MCQVDLVFGSSVSSQLFSEAVIKSKIGGWRSFEVLLDGKMIHSKLETGEFPDHNEIVQIVKYASNGGYIEPTEMMAEVDSARACNIL